MSLAPVESPSTTDTGGFNEELVHLICSCRPEYAFCDTFLGEGTEEEDGTTECVVCLDLAKWPCVGCGK